jgi:hypothetical protein
VKKTEAIKNLLLNLTHRDLADLYNYNMEVQVNVAQDNGIRVEGEYKGKHWNGWTDGSETWKSFRIPYNTSTRPEYEDKDLSFNLGLHVDAVGMTGWDWYNKQSLWVAYDFDDIISHKSGLTTDQLILIQEESSKVPWVTLRKSTGGNGLHLYVFIENPPSTNTHTEHQAVARAILGQLAAETGYNFINKVDVCGGNMWVWHRKMSTRNNGLKLIQQGVYLNNAPLNWKDHIKVVSGQSKKNLPQVISNIGEADILFMELTGQYVHEPLDDKHKELINFLKETNSTWWWDQDNYMLVTHTFRLKAAHDVLNLKGVFNTNSSGSTPHNCFCFPLRKGGWVVRRFTPGVREHESWDQDNGGWTRCYLNVEPDLNIAARNYEGIERPSGGYVFNAAESAQKAALVLKADLDLPPWALNRTTILKRHKDGRLVAEIHKEASDTPNDMKGWIPEGRSWKRILNTNLGQPIELENNNYDDVIRHLTTNTSDSGWVVHTNGKWIEEPLAHVKLVLKSMGLVDKDVNKVLGGNIFKHWTIVNKPFQAEYPGDRQWNRDACQLNFYPSKEDDLHYPTWLKILNQVGESLDTAIKDFDWAKDNGILTGTDYLKCWLASLFQYPNEPLPYLFLFGPEASGKSIFHEAISMLISKSGYIRAERVLLSEQGFSGELKTAIICIIEETDLSRHTSTAYNRIKDLVTSRMITIHPKGGTPYLIDNTTHWIQCGNNISYCPVFPGDTRITMIHTKEIPKSEWEAKNDILLRLRKEASDFLGELLKLELPKSSDRLNIPVLATSEKHILQQQNKNSLELFIEEQCFYAPGYKVKLSDFYASFVKWLDPAEGVNWSKQSIGKSLILPYVKGRYTGDQQFYIGNISFTEVNNTRKPFTVINNRLVVLDA